VLIQDIEKGRFFSFSLKLNEGREDKLPIKIEEKFFFFFERFLDSKKKREEKSTRY
jgi:hypothetical protein